MHNHKRDVHIKRQTHPDFANEADDITLSPAVDFCFNLMGYRPSGLVAPCSQKCNHP